MMGRKYCWAGMFPLTAAWEKDYGSISGLSFIALERSDAQQVADQHDSSADIATQSLQQSSENQSQVISISTSNTNSLGESDNQPVEDKTATTNIDVSQTSTFERDLLNTMSSLNVQKHLEAASKESQKLRWRITMCLFVIGWIPILALTAIFLCLAVFDVLSPDQFGQPLYYWGFVPVFATLCLLGLTPTDGLRIRITSFSVAVCLFLSAVMNLLLAVSSFSSGEKEQAFGVESDDIIYICGHGAPSSGCIYMKLNNIFLVCLFGWGSYYFSKNLSKVEGSSRGYDWNGQKGFRYNDSAFKIPARKALARTWFYVRAFALAMFVDQVSKACFFGQDTFPWFKQKDVHGFMFAGICWGLVGAIFNEKRRGQIMSFFFTIIQAEDEARSASTIAALIGNHDPSKCLALAKKNFKAIDFSKLTKEDFANNTENAGQENTLYNQTDVISLGKCDAFISHSWRDNGEKKFAALCTWAEKFEREKGRPPIVWLDKACIDQTNISSDLLCLPIFLSGCDTLLVLAGPSYIDRLWCVIEVFTFLKMGGSTDRITVMPIDLKKGQDPKTMFLDIDVSKSQCYMEEDRQRLLGIVESGFGNFDSFNEIVRNVFSERVSVHGSRKRSSFFRGKSHKVQPLSVVPQNATFQ